ncbi:2'-5' RNA ligase family protein [Kitasatospora sp. NPDC001175]|uniref:2'-5' RNA ligase family protein n=1 Tax=Kitasatospora sp. NPDC001175 TaxID=3157103 RepID=UPI003D02C48F
MHPSAPAAASVFPADQPPSLTDPQVIADHDWKAFSEVTTMVNHWDRPAWAPGRRRLYWFITMDDARSVHALTAHCQKHLSRPELDLTPVDGLHITLSRVAVADDKEVESLVASARALCAELEPFALQVLPLAGSRGAVRFSLAPWTPILRLTDVLVEAGAAVGAEVRTTADQLRPHLGIGYCNQEAPAEPLRKVIAGLRNLESVELAVPSVELVELRRDGRRYWWTSLARVRLGG